MGYNQAFGIELMPNSGQDLGFQMFEKDAKKKVNPSSTKNEQKKKVEEANQLLKESSADPEVAQFLHKNRFKQTAAFIHSLNNPKNQR